MSKLRAKIKINCHTCGCTLKRQKTIKVMATEKEAAIKEANEKVAKWQETLKGQNCWLCQDAIESLQ